MATQANNTEEIKESKAPKQVEEAKVDIIDTALLIIDIQKDYFSKSTSTKKAFPKFGEQISRLLDYARKLAANKRLKIIHFREIDSLDKSVWMKWYDELNPNEKAELAYGENEEFCKVENDEKLFIKQTWDAFLKTKLNEYLIKNGIKTLYFVGLETNGCVYNSIMSAFNYGYRIYVISDCCATYNIKYHQITLEMIDNVMAKVIDLKQFKDEHFPLK